MSIEASLPSEVSDTPVVPPCRAFEEPIASFQLKAGTGERIVVGALHISNAPVRFRQILPGKRSILLRPVRLRPRKLVLVARRQRSALGEISTIAIVLGHTSVRRRTRGWGPYRAEPD